MVIAPPFKLIVPAAPALILISDKAAPVAVPIAPAEVMVPPVFEILRALAVVVLEFTVERTSTEPLPAAIKVALWFKVVALPISIADPALVV